MEFVKAYLAAGFVTAIVHVMLASVCKPRLKVEYDEFFGVVFFWWLYLYTLAFGGKDD